MYKMQLFISDYKCTKLAEKKMFKLIYEEMPACSVIISAAD